MKKLMKAYDYFFYQIYKYFERSEFKWASDWKAEVFIDAIETYTLFSIVYYFAIPIHLIDEKVLIAILFLFTLVPNHFIFHHNNRWKKIVAEFDALPPKTNKIYGWLVFIIILLLIFNVYFSLYFVYISAQVPASVSLLAEGFPCAFLF